MTAPPQPTQEHRHQASVPIVVAICGDPLVGRALELLLRGSFYEARFIPTPSLTEPESLEGIRLLLLTPTWELDADRRDALFSSLSDASDAANAPILALTSSFDKSRNGHAHFKPDDTISWPCSPEELKRRIQAALVE